MRQGRRGRIGCRQRLSGAELPLHARHDTRADEAADIAAEAATRFGLVNVAIHHRIGILEIGDTAVLVVTSGDRRVDEKKVATLVGQVGRADADFVKAQTGFSIGGVSPVAHLNPLVTLLDQDLWRFDDIWAAAGHPHGVFQLRPDDLRHLTGAVQADVVVAP